MACFASAFVIAFVRQWKYTLVVIFILPMVLIIFGVGAKFLSNYSKEVVDKPAASATAEEVLSSIRTAQAYGSEQRLAKLYDDNLIGAQRMGYRVAFSVALMIGTMYFVVLGTYALAFCNV